MSFKKKIVEVHASVWLRMKLGQLVRGVKYVWVPLRMDEEERAASAKPSVYALCNKQSKYENYLWTSARRSKIESARKVDMLMHECIEVGFVKHFSATQQWLSKETSVLDTHIWPGRYTIANSPKYIQFSHSFKT